MSEPTRTKRHINTPPKRTPPEPPEKAISKPTQPSAPDQTGQNHRQANFVPFSTICNSPCKLQKSCKKNFIKFFSESWRIFADSVHYKRKEEPPTAEQPSNPRTRTPGKAHSRTHPPQTGCRQSHRKPHPPTAAKITPRRAESRQPPRPGGERKPPILTRWGEVLDRGLAMGLTSLGMP